MHTPPLPSRSSAANSAEAAATEAEAAMAVEERGGPTSLLPKVEEEEAGKGEEPEAEEEEEADDDEAIEYSAASLFSSSAISVRITLLSLPCVAKRWSLCTTSPPGAELEHLLLEDSASHGCASAAAAVVLLGGSRSRRPFSRFRASLGSESAGGESRSTSWWRMAPQTSWREAPETESQKGKEPGRWC